MTLHWGERAEQVHWLLSGRFLFTLSVFTFFFSIYCLPWHILTLKRGEITTYSSRIPIQHSKVLGQGNPLDLTQRCPIYVWELTGSFFYLKTRHIKCTKDFPLVEKLGWEFQEFSTGLPTHQPKALRIFHRPCGFLILELYRLGMPPSFPGVFGHLYT